VHSRQRGCEVQRAERRRISVAPARVWFVNEAGKRITAETFPRKITIRSNRGREIGPFRLCLSRSGRRDSNPRHLAWEASALPTELRPQRLDSTGALATDPRGRRHNDGASSGGK
jgi:hypothetical protein